MPYVDDGVGGIIWQPDPPGPVDTTIGPPSPTTDTPPPPPGTGPATPEPGTVPANPTTSGGIAAVLKALGISGAGLSPNVLTALASIGPALITAKKQWDLSSQMLDYGNTAANKYDPFGSQRAQYQQKLAALEANPDAIKDTPGYQFALKQGLGAVAGRDNRAFGLGAGSTSKDMMDYAQGLASKTYNDTISQLSQLSGSQFGPTGQSLQVAGMQADVNLKNQALQSLFLPIGLANAPVPNVTNNNNNANGPPGSPTHPTAPTAPTAPTVPVPGGGPGTVAQPPPGMNDPGNSGTIPMVPTTPIVDNPDPWDFFGPGGNPLGNN